MSDESNELSAVQVDASAKSTTDPLKSFLSGGFGGVCELDPIVRIPRTDAGDQACVLVGHPFDLTKTRMQTAVAGRYTGAVDVVRKTIAQDGIRG